METIDYGKINEYINNILNSNTISPFFINKLDYMVKISEKYKNYVSLIYESLNKYKIKTTNLPDSKIILCLKNILSNISYNYLNMFNELLENNLIIFIEDNIKNSCYIFDENTKNSKIIINKHNNYSDICILIHEFMHYVNFNKNNFSLNGYDLSEFLSIYYELYSMKYLINKKRLSPKNFDLKTRVINTYECADDIINYYPLFLIYNYSKITDKSYEHSFTDCPFKISKEMFDIMCIRLNHHIDHNKNNDYKKTGKYIEDTLSYILGTYLSFYSIYNLDINDIFYISKNMSRIDVDTEKILSNVGINLNENFENESIDNMNRYLKELKII